MTRKKQIAAECEPVDRVTWSKNHLIRKRSDMGQADEDGANDYEQRETLQYERERLRLVQQHADNENPKNNSAVHEQPVDVEYRNIR